MLKYRLSGQSQQMEAFAATTMSRVRRRSSKKSGWIRKENTACSTSARTTQRILQAINEFQPHLVLLGDDNAANYIGTQLLDTDIPVVFWGINGLPLKYGLVDSMDNPGHNVTGVWQAGYHKESLELLHLLVPDAKTFAILSCDSETARANIKQLRALAKRVNCPCSWSRWW